MAADRLSELGHPVTVYDAMPSVGRKFLLAGKSGLNLTHSEPFGLFATRFGAAAERLESALAGCPPEAIRFWAEGLGCETFVGSSGRIFPKAMKASPLLRAWLARLSERGVVLRTRHAWTGWTDDGALRFLVGPETVTLRPRATLLALGGASWPRMGSTGAWVPLLEERGVRVLPFGASNCGYDVGWSDHMRGRFAGAPVKSVRVGVGVPKVDGEFVVTATGVEGGAIYAVGGELRAAAAGGAAVLTVDLTPHRSRERLEADLAAPRGKQSIASHLRKRAGLDGVKAALLHEFTPRADFETPERLARAIKTLRLRLERPRPLAEAISSHGGTAFDEIDETYMLKKLPGVFVAGEMIDWDAPTGGYLLTACLATGRAAADGIADRLSGRGG